MSEEDHVRQEPEVRAEVPFVFNDKKYMTFCFCGRVHCTTAAAVLGSFLTIASFVNIGLCLISFHFFQALLNTVTMLACISLLVGLCGQAVGPIRVFVVWMKLFIAVVVPGIIVYCTYVLVSENKKVDFTKRLKTFAIECAILIGTAVFYGWLAHISQVCVVYQKAYNKHYIRRRALYSGAGEPLSDLS